MIKKLVLLISFITLILSINPLAFAQKTFTNVAKAAGVDRFFQSIDPVWGDYDNDGDLDLYVTGGDHQNSVMVPDVFYRNNGDGTFTDVTAEAGFAKNKGDSRYAGFLDYDNDGFPDLYISNQIWEADFANFENQILLYRNKGDGTFTDVTEDAQLEPIDFSYAGGFADYNNDGFLDMYLTVSWWFNVLYQNDGDGVYKNVAKEAGVENVVGGQGDCGFNFTSGDYDGDGDMDIFLPGGGGLSLGPAVLYRNNGDGTFTNVAINAGIKDKSNGRNSLFFDYNNDGNLDIITVGGTSPLHLYRNNGDGTFKDVAWETKLSTASYEILTVGDYDNDGYMDVYLVGWGGPKVLFRNKGDGTFTNVTQEAGVSVGGGRTGGCTFGDYDNDGDLDLFVSNLDGFNELFRNEGNDNHWLHIICTGSIGEIPINVKRTNRDGVGARVILKAGNLSMIREINPGCSRGHSPLIAYFGLGQNATADSVEIRWPSGQITNLTNIPADQMIEVKEGKEGYTKIEVEPVKYKSVEPQEKITTTWGNLKRSELYQNYPNPSNPETWIPYQLESDAYVKIMIHDLSGQLIRTLNLGYKLNGAYLSKDKAAYWDGKNEDGEPVVSGIYFYSMYAGDFAATKKMLIVK